MADLSERWTLVRALGCIGPEALPALWKASRDPCYEVRRAAVCAIANIDPKSGASLPAVEAAASDRCPEVRQVALNLLAEVRRAAAQPGK
ncbi:MAG: HEAT repeat domain-containing protein [Planctomycetes bacterium]|nr:HEAT repeat domain-containing protein [Planctomycetota bacterium]